MKGCVSWALGCVCFCSLHIWLHVKPACNVVAPCQIPWGYGSSFAHVLYLDPLFLDVMNYTCPIDISGMVAVAHIINAT